LIEPNVEDIMETTDSNSTFEKIINMPFMKAETGKPPPLPYYSKLGCECFDKIDDELARILPVYALGHNDPEIRRLANELFEALFITRWANDP